MARLVFLAVLLAAATYANAQDASAPVTYLNVSSCTKGDQGACKMCDKSEASVGFAVGACTKTGDSYYKAECKAAAGTEKATWKLELFSAANCPTGNHIHTMGSSDGACFTGQHTTAKVTKITAKAGEHEVVVNVCPPAATATMCNTVADDDATCKPQTLTVKADTQCEAVMIKESADANAKDKTYYYRALVEEKKTTPAKPPQKANGKTRTHTLYTKPNVLTLTLYPTKQTCIDKKLPVFVGEKMEVGEETGCKTYQQEVNADACAVPVTPAPAPAETTTTTNNSSGDTNNSSDETTESGSAAVSAVLALLAAACAVWMM